MTLQMLHSYIASYVTSCSKNGISKRSLPWFQFRTRYAATSAASLHQVEPATLQAHAPLAHAQSHLVVPSMEGSLSPSSRAAISLFQASIATNLKRCDAPIVRRFLVPDEAVGHKHG